MDVGEHFDIGILIALRTYFNILVNTQLDEKIDTSLSHKVISLA